MGTQGLDPVSIEASALLRCGELPRFDLFDTDQVVPSIRQLLGELASALDALEARVEPTWEGLVLPLERMNERLAYAWGLVSHMLAVRNSDALRTAHETVQGEVIAFGLRQAQSPAIHDGLQRLRGGPAFAALDATQQRIVDCLLRDARHSGVGLEPAKRARFNEIQAELAQLGTRFNNHVLDATRAFSILVRDPAEMAGTPPSLRALTAQNARENGEPDATAESGPWRLSLDAPVLIPFLEHGASRPLRERLYRANIGRAASGELDNTPVLEGILALRQEMARLLGFASYAELSLDAKMAPGLAAVDDLLERLRLASIPGARADLASVQAFAAEGGQREPIALWDVPYWAERLRERRFDYSEEALRPYFPLPRVLDGLFALAKRLFDVEIAAADGETPVWHPDVRFFRVRDGAGQPIAAFFLDPYSRPGDKRGGAWMDDCIGRTRRAAENVLRLPVAYLVCNQSPPVGTTPSLMAFDEVLTLFHEFGHGLQHMLTRVDHGMASGIRNIEWDAVELPSQFMENWCYHRETLLGLSRHVETGEPLPDALFEKITQARTFRAGTFMLRQLYFAMLDLALHRDPGIVQRERIFAVQAEIAARTTVMPLLPEDRFLCSFGHIFAGGYAAGYYSYKWAEVLSADAFSAFEEAGLENPRALAATGRRFRDTVLASGGGVPPMRVFEAFRGRAPSPEALLRHSGLAGVAA
jgi:oligopeptidase A